MHFPDNVVDTVEGREATETGLLRYANDEWVQSATAGAPDGITSHFEPALAARGDTKCGCEDEAKMLLIPGTV